MLHFSGKSVMGSKKELGRPSSDISYCSNFTFHLSGKRIWVRLYSKERGFAKDWEEWHSLPLGNRGLDYFSRSPMAFIFNVPCVWKERGWEVEITMPLKCCFLRTVYRILVINNLSQDSYFWSGLLGGNLLEVNSFILRLTVLPFPAERGEKWNHMFWGANGGNPSEDKWRLLSPGN